MPSSIGNDIRSAVSVKGYSVKRTARSLRHTTAAHWIAASLTTILLFHFATGTIANADNVVVSKPTHPFMNVETSCTSDTLLIVASLQEPFFGLIYANGFATSSSCRAEGTGNRLLRLALNVTECGVHLTQSEDGSRQLELSLYLQYDIHVQQAVDEKMTTRCRLQTEKSTTTTESSPTTTTTSSQPQRQSAIFSIDKSSRRNEVGPPATTIKNTVLLPFRPLMNNSLTSTTLKLSGLPLTSYQAKKLEMNRDSKISALPSTVSSGALKLLPASAKQRDAISCWMDIVAGQDPTGNPVETYLRVGQEATVVVRVRQTVGLDTRLTSCVAHDGSHESQQQELLDADGCSLDTSILPNVQERIINRSGSTIKLLYANFQAFRFPNRDHLHLRCIVVVCKGKCLMNPCNLIRRKGRGTNSSNKFTENKGFGHLGSIRQLTAQEMSEAAVRPARGRNNDRSLNSNTDSKSRLRTGSLRSSNLTTAINSIPNYGAVIDKVDVFNSVEIRVASASSNADDAFRGYTSKSTSDDDLYISSEEAIFCLTPSKLFMAFGILFAVLISAMLFAVCVCIRIKTNKNQQKIQQQQQQQRCNPYSSSSPPRFLSSSPRPQAPMLNPACIRHPSNMSGRHQLQLNLNRHNSAAPYMRVFK